MSRKLSELHHNNVVFLDRVELNNIVSEPTKMDAEQREVLKKVLERVVSREIRENNPCMNVPIRVWELKKLFPNYETEPPVWWER